MDNFESHSPNLPFLTARKIGNAVINHVLDHSMPPVSVSITNRSGQEIFFASMDGVAPASDNVAKLKAKQSAYTGKRTSVTIKQIEAGTITADVLGLPTNKLMPYAGGVPIFTEDGILLGGIGVSGLKQEEDEELAINGVESNDLDEDFLSEKPQR